MQEHISDAAAAGIFAGFGTLSGVLSYLNAVLEGRPFRWMAFLVNASVSGACSFFVGEALLDYGLSLRITLAICGMVGWMGPHLPKLIESIFVRLTLRRYGIPPKEDQK